jgi:hypothetical protein
MSFQREYVRCGKGCKGCPHGPYWYEYWREGKRTRKRYWGKHHPFADYTNESREHHPVYERAQMSDQVAREILTGNAAATNAACKRAFRQRIKAAHPDRGGTTEEARQLIAAWTWLKASAKL